ncbi:hypothetical protein FUAX_36600 [Fulvitalea axinellae]|uniref:Uncharacterized protein n=1 Tax=Fulvitalea axinellae TaxID=1182444 RepID=A0AAU9D5E6_9BACT|nr:hypothetical protein FUAX_36600 [Fulvitalea axinellae]
MSDQTTYYQESGKVDAFRFGLVAVGGAIVVLVLAYVYAVAAFKIPFPYVNLFLTIGFGLILGVLVRVAGRFGHFRARRSRLVYALGLGFLACYLQWCASFALLAGDYFLGGGFPGFGEYLAMVVRPEVFSILPDLYAYGVWTVFGIPINGALQGLVWTIEAGIIIGLPLVPVFRVAIYPFSERLGEWYPKFTLSPDFASVAGSAELVEALRTDTVEAIGQMGLGTGWRHTKVHVFYSKDEDSQYITLERVFVEDRGAGKTEKDVVINNLQVSKATAEALMEQFEGSRERLEVV